MELGFFGRRAGDPVTGSGAPYLVPCAIRITSKIGRKSKIGFQGKKDGAQIGQGFEGGGCDLAVCRSEKDEGAAQLSNKHGHRMQKFTLARGDREDGRDGVLGPCADLEGVEQSELGDFEVEAKFAAKGAAKSGPVEVPRDTFILDNSVFVAPRPSALADASQGAVFARDNFVQAATIPRTRNERSQGVGPRGQEKGLEGVEVGSGNVLGPGGGEGGGAGDGFEGEPEARGNGGHDSQRRDNLPRVNTDEHGFTREF